jgi:hypothetical protein
MGPLAPIKMHALPIDTAGLALQEPYHRELPSNNQIKMKNHSTISHCLFLFFASHSTHLVFPLPSTTFLIIITCMHAFVHAPLAQGLTSTNPQNVLNLLLGVPNCQVHAFFSCMPYLTAQSQQRIHPDNFLLGLI